MSFFCSRNGPRGFDCNCFFDKKLQFYTGSRSRSPGGDWRSGRKFCGPRHAVLPIFTESQIGAELPYVTGISTAHELLNDFLKVSGSAKADGPVLPPFLRQRAAGPSARFNPALAASDSSSGAHGSVPVIWIGL